MLKYDIVIVGAGPAGIFTALEMLRRSSEKKILIVEKGVPIEKRACAKAKTHVCMNCKPYCHITTGFSGAGAFSDGKLSLSCEVGGNLPELIGEQLAQDKCWNYAFGDDEERKTWRICCHRCRDVCPYNLGSLNSGI